MPDWLKKFIVVLACWVVLVIVADIPQSWFSSYWVYIALGVLGAVFANSTGAGGGVVFVPFFDHLGFDASQTVATSFAIQCCGMTAGAITWFQVYLHNHRNNLSHENPWRALPQSILLTVPSAAAGILLAQYGDIGAPGGVNTVFGIFSIVLAISMFATIAKSNKAAKLKAENVRMRLDVFDRIALCITGFVGGLITAWLSVGVGELIAVYLIMRGFNVTVSIAVAVIVSAFAVWVGVAYHGVVTQAIYYQIVLFAGIGAILGGLTAKYLVLAFSPLRLKMFFASWVFILGVGALPLF